MTTQFADYVLFNRAKYELLSDKVGIVWSLLDPYGIEYGGCLTTACYRGYFAEYEVIADCLYLTKVELTTKGNYYPEIANVKPNLHGLYQAGYEGLRVKVAINGAITIGKDAPEDGARPAVRFPHDYMHVLKLRLKQGCIEAVTDISAEAALVREEMQRIKDRDSKLTGHNWERYYELHQQSRALMES